jgi:hypothetical protein
VLHGTDPQITALNVTSRVRDKSDDTEQISVDVTSETEQTVFVDTIRLSLAYDTEQKKWIGMQRTKILLASRQRARRPVTR